MRVVPVDDLIPLVVNEWAVSLTCLDDVVDAALVGWLLVALTPA
jgi:hypothetical protein